MIKSVIFIFLLLFLSSFADQSDERYNIYRAIINNQYKQEISEHKIDYLIIFKKKIYDTLNTIHIFDHTHFNTDKSVINSIKKRVKNEIIDNNNIIDTVNTIYSNVPPYEKTIIDTQIISDYLKSHDNSKIENKIGSKTKTILILKYPKEIETEINNNKSYGYLSFSQIGFNKDSSQALIGYDYVCGRCCGGYNYSILFKINKEWKVVANLLMSKH
jgi:hypothetical protein